MKEKERYAEHTVAWELPTRDSATKGNYNLADIETKYIPIQTEMISDDKDRKITDLKAKLAERDKRIRELEQENQQLKEEVGYIIFADGYGKNGNEIHRQEFVKYKDKFKELLEENKQLKKQISKREETHKRIMSGEYIPANVAEKSLKLTEQSQKQLAISELEKIKKFCDEKYFNPGGYRLKVVSLDQIEDFLDYQIKELKGEE